MTAKFSRSNRGVPHAQASFATGFTSIKESLYDKVEVKVKVWRASFKLLKVVLTGLKK